MLISPKSPDFLTCYSDLSAITAQSALHEQATHFAFSKLLDSIAKPRGYWEAKDPGDFV